MAAGLALCLQRLTRVYGKILVSVLRFLDNANPCCENEILPCLITLAK